MVEEQGGELLELVDGVVGGRDGLATLHPCDTHTNVRFSNHRHIISAITHRQHGLLLVVLLHKLDHVAFLLG